MSFKVKATSFQTIPMRELTVAKRFKQQPTPIKRKSLWKQKTLTSLYQQTQHPKFIFRSRVQKDRPLLSINSMLYRLLTQCSKILSLGHLEWTRLTKKVGEFIQGNCYFQLNSKPFTLSKSIFVSYAIEHYYELLFQNAQLAYLQLTKLIQWLKISGSRPLKVSTRDMKAIISDCLKQAGCKSCQAIKQQMQLAQQKKKEVQFREVYGQQLPDDKQLKSESREKTRDKKVESKWPLQFLLQSESILDQHGRIDEVFQNQCRKIKVEPMQTLPQLMRNRQIVAGEDDRRAYQQLLLLKESFQYLLRKRQFLQGTF